MTNSEAKATKKDCEHEWGHYTPNDKTKLNCSECGVALDMITRKPITK